MSLLDSPYKLGRANDCRSQSIIVVSFNPSFEIHVFIPPYVWFFIYGGSCCSVFFTCPHILSIHPLCCFCLIDPLFTNFCVPPSSSLDLRSNNFGSDLIWHSRWVWSLNKFIVGLIWSQSSALLCHVILPSDSSLLPNLISSWILTVAFWPEGEVFFNLVWTQAVSWIWQIESVHGTNEGWPPP